MVGMFHLQSNSSNYEEQHKNVLFMEQKLIEMQNEARKFNQQEELLGIPTTDYTHIQTLTKTFSSYSNIWRVISVWKNNHTPWMTDNWSTLDPLEIENFIESDYKTFIQSIKQIKILQSKSEEPAKFQALLDTLETQKLEISQFK